MSGTAMRGLARVLRIQSTTDVVDFVTNNILLLALISLGAYFASQTNTFLTGTNILTLMENEAALGVVAVTLAILVICGHVDLSIGSNAAFSGMIGALAATEWGLPTGLAFVLGIVAGGFAGSINGFLCGILGFNSIIVTLGMLGVLRGTTLLLHQEQVFGLGGVFDTVGSGHSLGIPNILWFTVAMFLLGAFFISFTPWGRHIYAIGVNPQAAYLSALPVKWLPFWLFVATGAGAGLSGVLLASRLAGVSPGNQGLQLELQALTVILLGGVAFAGGRGRMIGVLFAWLFLATLQNGLVLMNVAPYVQLVASGLALVFAAALDTFGAVLASRLQERRRVGRQLDGAESPARGAEASG